MITLRYHIVSIAAVFLALATGIAVGSTSVSARLLWLVGGDHDAMSKQVSQLQAERNGLKIRLGAADRFAGALAPVAVRGQLDQRSVVLISTWDASPRDHDALRRLLEAAGAKVTGEVQLTEGIVDPDRAEQLRQSAARLLPAGAQLPAASDPGAMAGGLLGSVVLLNPRTGQPQATPQERAAALGGLADGGFATATADLQPAQFAVVLTGAGPKAPDSADRSVVLARVASQLDRAGSGAVLAGPARSADGSGPVGVARADTAISSGLSTVDDVDNGAGRVAAVLALRERGEKQVGHYGAAATAQGPIPDSYG